MGPSVRAGLTAGALSTILVFTLALSYAALIFAGDMSPHVRLGITGALISTAIVSIAVACFGSLRFAIGGPGANQAAVVAVAAAAIERSLAGAAPATALATILVGIALSTMATGIFLWGLGTVRAGHWMRFIPYPVVGGVLGAAGWLFVTGSLRVVGTSSRAELTVGIVFAAIVIVATTRLRNALTLPALLAAGTVGFYVVLFVRAIPIESARQAGGFFSVAHGSALVNPWDPAILGAIDWSILERHASDLVTLFVVTALMVLLGTSAFEVLSREEADLDRELRTQGLANVLGGLGGGLIGNAQVSTTTMSYGIGGASRIPPLFVAVASIGLIFGGATVVEAIPRFVIGALLFTVGFNLLWEWCVRAARRLPLSDYISILAIIAVVVRFGYVAGVLTGILIGCVIFVVTYSQVRVVKHSLSGVEFHSGVVRSPEDAEVLRTQGAAIRILILQGFIFFGMADRLYRTIQALISEAAGTIRSLILDFHAVSGLDSSATSSFAKLRRLGDRNAIELIFTGMPAALERRWVLAGGADAQAIVRFADLDDALERCENHLLERFAPGHAGARLHEWLRRELRDTDAAARLVPFLSERALAKGDVLCSEGEPADGMFFVERGRVGVFVGMHNGQLRLRSLGDRTIIGEMGLYRNSVRSASVVAEMDSVVHVLSRDAFARIEREDPALAATFSAAIVRTLAERLEFENAVVVALQR